MRILVVSSYLPPHLGGLEVVAEQQLENLAKHGHEVSVFTSHCGAQTGVSQSKNGATIHRLWVLNFLEEKLGAAFPIFMPDVLWKVYKLVKRADIVHVHDAFYLSSFVAAFWAWMLRKPLVVTQHVALVPHPNPIVNLGQNIIYNTTGSFILRTSKKIFILNSRVRQFLIDHHIDKAKIIHLPNGVDTSLFQPPKLAEQHTMREKYNLPLKKPIALFVGRFVPKKGFHKLLKIKGEGFHIALAGGVAPTEYKNDPHFTFLGCLTAAQLSEVYKACDMFILPSEGEGFPLTVQEAMASGLPIITTDDPGYNVYNFDKKYISLIDPTIEQISKTLEAIATDAARRKKMGSYSRDYAVRSFSWDKNIASIMQVYSELQS